MKLAPSLALGAALAALSLPAAAQRLGQEKPKDARPDMEEKSTKSTTTTKTSSATDSTGRKRDISKGAQAAIVALQTAVNANDAANIPARLAAAQAVAKTADDRYFIASLQVKAALAAGDLAALKTGVEALEASGGADAADLGKRYADLGNRFHKAGQAAPAAAALEKAIKADPSNPQAMMLLADLRSKQGNNAEAVSLMQRSFAASKARGEKVAENNYKFAAGLAYKLRSPAALDITRDWLAAYPTATGFREGLRLYRDISGAKGAALADAMRLARAANALNGRSDYYAYVVALLDSGATTEAKAVLAEAAASGINVQDSAFKTLSTRAAAAPARAAADAAAKTALAGGSASALIAAGDSLYGLGAYAEAAPLYRAAVAKGDTGLANLRLGMALARSGDKAGATAALNAVAGPNQTLARFWLLWLASRG
ncbi:tetratricopeptide repeat protein [Sphingomonas mesophila]|uniref:tetratricopeptide repeat protein n=1 Tax=Sphingomonas mesophila TaxID=2303576 RepID=UPI000E57C906|nr:tetratricopeptide repeat protein [Sphingomonas mesophila]